jgi:flagellar biogenesis protein FliO
MPENPPTITEAHIKRFQHRARLHFGISYVILIGVLGLFGFAIYIFLFAQEIDRSKGSIEILQELQIGKADQTLVVNVAQREADNANKRLREGTVDLLSVLNAVPALGEARTKLQLFEEQIRLMNQSGYVADTDRPRSREELIVVSNGKKQMQDEIKAVLAFVEQRFKEGTASQLDVLMVTRVLSQANLEQELFEQRAKVAQPAAQLKTVATNLDTIELVRTSLVRFGGVAVILFLISLLTPIYRYNVRLGTFFQARADTLLLSRDTHVQNFAEMIRLLTPAYAFEKEPTTPVESIASFAKEAGGIIRKS